VRSPGANAEAEKGRQGVRRCERKRKVVKAQQKMLIKY
jgi:hypothetical protein